MRQRLGYVAIVLLVLLAGSAIRLIDPAPTVRLRLQVFDTYQLLRPRLYDPTLPVRIVDIDDASLARIGQWPWPRTVTASLVSKLAAMGATVIALDMVFPEPDRLSPAQLLKLLPKDDVLAALEAKLLAQPSNDQVLAAAFAGGPVVLGFIATPDETASLPRRHAPVEHIGHDPRPFLAEFKGVTASLPLLQDSAKGSGALNWLPEHDQIVRRIPLLVRIGQETFPTLVADSIRLAQPGAGYVVASSDAPGEKSYGAKTGISGVRIGGVGVPTDPYGQMWLAYTPHDERRFISASAVLEGLVSPQQFEGRVVLIGTSAAGLHESRATPLDPAMPGVEIHAQAIEQILLGTFLVRPDYATGAELVFLATTGLIVAALISYFGAVVGALVGALSLAGVVSVSWLAYARHGWLFDPVFPSLVLVCLFIASTVHRYRATEAERNRVRNAFGYYLAPALVEELARSPDKLRLGGEMRTVTLLFCDVRNFTGIAERLDASELTSFLNSLFTPLSDTILATRGTIDKYMGDGVMAFWNAPLDDPDQASNAALCALRMLEDLALFNATWTAQEGAHGLRNPPVRIGIGLNTAECCVGNFGTTRHFDYSAIGDGVNLASRLEGQSKTYGLPIIVGEQTARAAADLAFLEIDLLSVKGKSEAIRVFALLGDQTREQSAAFIALRDAMARMLTAYRGRRFDEATRLLEEVRGLGGLEVEALCGIYAERIARFVRTPPPPEWDGREIAETK